MLYQVVSIVADKLELFIEDEMTVGEVRVLIWEMIGTDDCEKTLRLTFQGHVLEDNMETWSSVLEKYPLGENTPRKLFVHFSDRPQTGAASLEALRAALPSSVMNSEDEKAARAHARLMEPMIDAMVQNPDLVDMMVASEPNLKRMLRDQPEMARLFRDPETMKSLIMSQIDPDQSRLMSRNLQLQLAQVSAIPGGEQMLERYTSSFLRDAERDLDSIGQRSDGDIDEMQARPDPTKAANSEALPNPWRQQTPSVESAPGCNMMDAFLGAFGDGRGGGESSSGHMPFLGLVNGAPPMAPLNSSGATPFVFPWTVPPVGVSQGQLPSVSQGNGATSGGILPDAARWASQLAMLKEMGFDDEALCIEALRATDGDVDNAVSFIMDKMG